MRDRLYVATAQTLGVAFLITLGFTAISFLLPDGREAVLTIGGLHRPDTMPEAMNIAFLLDTAFPIFYGAGLICLTTALSARSVRPLSRVMTLMIFIVVICDITENHLIMNGFTSAEGPASITSSITGVKYGLVGLFAIGLSVMIPPASAFHRLIIIAARIFFPLLIAAYIALGGNGSAAADVISGLVSLSFLFLLASLSWIAWQAHKASTPNITEPQSTTSSKDNLKPSTGLVFPDKAQIAPANEKEKSGTEQKSSENGDDSPGFELVSYRKVSTKSPDSKPTESEPMSKKAKKRKKKKSKK